MQQIILPGCAISVIETIDICNNEKMVTYVINYNQLKPQGKGVLYIKRLEELTNGLSHEKKLFQILSQEGFTPQNLVSRMESFYPNGEKLTPEQLRQYSRKGIGSILFKLMVAHALKEDAKAIYTVSGTDSGMSFFRKKELTEVDTPGFQANLFYKLI
ncbi:hypothetical protein KY306_00860 [Candidatus Woesearchaeota archaeon]|nr:hypothetical protein [Candidatus Woesearchaeota archaeon]